MTPGARAQAATEILDAIAAEGAPADLVAGGYLRARRYIGAKDRAAVAVIVYGVLRHRAQLDWWIARTREGKDRGTFAPDGRQRVLAWLAIGEGWEAAKIGAEFDGDRFRPKALDRREAALADKLAGRTIDHPDQPDWVRFNYPQWVEDRLRARFGPGFANEMAALATTAPLDLRINPLKSTRAAAIDELRSAGLKVEPTPISPLGVRVEGRPPLGEIAAYRDGRIEVQDEGSQLAALLVDAKPGMRVCDFCAGAGGKTLAIAAMMANKGHVVACDVSQKRLEGATRRLRRAGVHNVERRNLSGERDPWVKRHAGGFDRVLVDAPCTGTGTWRRNPDARWTLLPNDLVELAELQRRILDSAARLVKPGGRLIYVTCSLLHDENEQQAEWFSSAWRDFANLSLAKIWTHTIGLDYPGEGPFLHLSPGRHGTDGFFIAAFERMASRTNGGAPEPGATG